MLRKNGPWTILESRTQYQNSWMGLRVDTVIYPDGKQGEYGVVSFPLGISVLPIDEQGEVYLVEEFRYAIGRKSIEACSGAMEKGEPPLNCAQREMEEELGIHAQEWIDLGAVYPFTGNIDTPAYLFLARGLRFVPAHPEASEGITVVKVPLETAVKMVMESQIVHAPSCVLIMKGKTYL